MAERVPVAILGGSSAFTPALAHELAQAHARLPGLDVRLQGRDATRLLAVARFCQALAEQHGAPQRWSAAASLEDAARGARLVINQMRVGGFAGRTHDETFPLAHGLPGDETIGPGGLASALRTVPVVVAAARAVARVADDPWFVNLTNPLSIVVRALRDVPGIRPLGLCELPGVTLSRALAKVGKTRADVDVDYFGSNHQGWFTRVEAAGRDLLDELLPPGAPPHGVRALPLPYLRLYAEREETVRALRARPLPRGRELERLAADLHGAYAAWRPGTPARLPAAMARRDVPWLRLAVVPCLESLLAGAEHELWVTTRNGSTYADLPEDAVVELRCRVGRAGPVPFAVQERPAREVVALVARVVEFEREALLAAREPTRERVLAALRTHPFDLDERTAEALVAPTLQPVA